MNVEIMIKIVKFTICGLIVGQTFAFWSEKTNLYPTVRSRP